MADIVIDFSGVTVPTPEPFDKNQPERQRENLSYVMMQIVEVLKSNTYTITLPENSTVTADIGDLLTQIRDALTDLKFNGQQVTYTSKDAKITIDYLGQYTETP